MFEFEVISGHKTSFCRQLTEAVEIMTFCSRTLLNRKEIFNRCLIPEIFLKAPKTNKNKKKKKTNSKDILKTKKEQKKRTLAEDRQYEENLDQSIAITKKKQRK